VSRTAAVARSSFVSARLSWRANLGRRGVGGHCLAPKPAKLCRGQRPQKRGKGTTSAGGTAKQRFTAPTRLDSVGVPKSMPSSNPALSGRVASVASSPRALLHHTGWQLQVQTLPRWKPAVHVRHQHRHRREQVERQRSRRGGTGSRRCDARLAGRHRRCAYCGASRSPHDGCVIKASQSASDDWGTSCHQNFFLRVTDVSLIWLQGARGRAYAQLGCTAAQRSVVTHPCQREALPAPVQGPRPGTLLRSCQCCGADASATGAYRRRRS
jgi:hypothetical protein